MSEKTTTSFKSTRLGIMAQNHIEHNPDLKYDYRRLMLSNKLDDFIEKVAQQSNEIYLKLIEQGDDEYDARDTSRQYLLKVIREQIKQA